MGFSRQGYWSGLPFPSPEDLPHPGVEPRSPTLQADTLLSEPPGKPYSFKDLVRENEVKLAETQHILSLTNAGRQRLGI